MKQKRYHITLSWLLLAVFAFAQLPFSLLHHHEHNVPCALVADEGKDNDGSKAHFHTSENSECFICSGYLLKKEYTTSFSLTSCTAAFAAQTSFTAIEKPADQPRELHSSRAPPSISL